MKHDIVVVVMKLGLLRGTCEILSLVHSFCILLA